ncbi:MAG: hypothetical protein HFG54_11960 [Lachnospiraceae bacterium]|jgi:5-methylcytosine-specific restriction enzyme subunit McrC|nr:hypothetical protein [Lachnospiraceae bacterium]
MESEVIHIPQGGLLGLLNGEKELLKKVFVDRGIGLDCIDFQQNIVKFPQAYVGYINFPMRRIVIDPKHEGIDLRHILRVYYFLYATEISDLDDPIYDVDRGSAYDLVELFISELDKVAKKGLPVEYKESRENLQYLRGNINAVQTLLNKRLGRREPFDCSFDELSKDIPINQILYKAYNKAVRIMDTGKAALLKRDFAGVSEIYDIPDVKLNINTMYCKKAIALAHMILNDLSVSDYGSQTYGQNVLINFDKIFEYFVKKILISYSGDHNFSYWDEEKRYAVCMDSDNNEYLKSYIPDMLYLCKEQGNLVRAFCILDMKNKTSKPFTNADVYQMFFYANQLQSRKVILCYPSCEDRNNARLRFDNESFSLKKIDGIYINLAGDTSAEFKENINRFINKVMAVL